MAKLSGGPYWLIQLVGAVTVVILLFIVLVPNVTWDPAPPPAVYALSEIKNAETALTGMMADSQCDLDCLFNTDGVAARRSDLMQREGLDAFEASVRIYSTAFAALLNHGQNAETALAEHEEMEGIFHPVALRRLGSSYVELREDPWGQAYQFFVGPWPKEWGPPVFRIHGKPAEELGADSLTVTLADGTRAGFPVPTTLPIYIWSLGANGVSDQARFDSSGTYAGAPRDHYRADAADNELGGGDDISNWDSEMSWEQFYPRSQKLFGCRR